MATTANYSISLIEEGTYDWKLAFDQIIEAIDAVMAKNQMPSGISLKWGDITNGAYLEVDATGPRCHGSLDMLLNQVKNLVIHKGGSLPSSGTAGQLFYNSTNSTLYVSSGSAWEAIGAVTSAAIQAAGGLLSSSLGNSAGVLLSRDASLNLTSVAPSGQNQVAVSTANNTLVFQNISDFFATGQSLGSLRVGSGSNAEAFLALPSTDAEGQILTVANAAANKVSWRTPSQAVGAVFSEKGQLAVGTGSGTLALTSAPLDNQVLVGDPTKVSGWAVKNISDIVSFNANDAVVSARLFANATLG